MIYFLFLFDLDISLFRIKYTRSIQVGRWTVKTKGCSDDITLYLTENTKAWHKRSNTRIILTEIHLYFIAVHPQRIQMQWIFFINKTALSLNTGRYSYPACTSFLCVQGDCQTRSGYKHTIKISQLCESACICEHTTVAMHTDKCEDEHSRYLSECMFKVVKPVVTECLFPTSLFWTAASTVCSWSSTSQSRWSTRPQTERTTRRRPEEWAVDQQLRIKHIHVAF